MQCRAGQGRAAQCGAGGLANPVAGLLADHIEPIGRRVRDVVLVLVSESLHDPFVVVSQNAQQDQECVRHEIGNAVFTPEFERGTKAVLEHITPSSKFDRPDFIEQDVGHEADEDGDGFEKTKVDVLGGGNQKDKEGGDECRGQAVPHSTVDRVSSEQFGDAESEEEVDPAGDQKHHFVGESDSLKSAHHQHGDEGRSECDGFSKWNARIAI